MSLFWRIFVMNAIVLVTAALLLLSPWVTVSSPVHFGEAMVLVAGVIAMLVADALLFRIGLAPLKRLSKAMAVADLVRPGGRPKVVGHGEMAELVQTYDRVRPRR
ncbi:hypothetical protein ACIA8F_19770 [Streptomyces sp. NPDC051563]|uniref:hypothetical protein n=1 Tax=Streptomyces sp. NPDC051563 TaxID=3365659 RepID=UPI0037AC47B4